MSPAKEYAMEKLIYNSQLYAMGWDKHLKDIEKQYQTLELSGGDIHVIHENEHGWWRENIQLESNFKEQMEKLAADSGIALIFVLSFRFTEPGGWYDPCG